MGSSPKEGKSVALRSSMSYWMSSVQNSSGVSVVLGFFSLQAVLVNFARHAMLGEGPVILREREPWTGGMACILRTTRGKSWSHTASVKWSEHWAFWSRLLA